jgi:hypothetical protein
MEEYIQSDHKPVVGEFIIKVRVQVLTVAGMKVAVFWVVVPCSWSLPC